MTLTRHISLPLLATIAALSLGGCKGETDPKEAAASSGVDAKPGIAINGARVVLPAVPENPGVAYFSVDNQSKDNVSIVAVSVDVAGRSEMHTTEGNEMKKVDRADAGARTHLDFAPGGLHVMLFDLKTGLKAGDAAEITVTYADGDKTSVPAKIESAGEAAMGGMAMEHKN